MTGFRLRIKNKLICGIDDSANRPSLTKKMAGRSHQRLLIILSLVVFLMFVFAFALVPIYNSLCRSLGINGKVNLKSVAFDPAHTVLAGDRWVTVEFLATKNQAIPWDFYPMVHKIRVHPGELAKLAFYAENKTDRRMTVQAIPSVTPGIAAKYIKKTECFCFTQQTLNGHEGMNMPLIFHLDAALPESVKTMTLAYTLFDVTDRVSSTQKEIK